jgi:methanogenic corrinoid protein MtbC1
MAETSPKQTQRQELIQLVADLQEQEALSLVQTRIFQNEDPLLIVEDCQEGLRRVGERYEKQIYYLSGLIMAGEIFREAMELLTPVIAGRFKGSHSGVILLGTVQGDIHEIGKNNLSLLLTCYGFTVHDLGVDAPPEAFADAALQLHPDVIGLSGLMTSSYDSMRQTVALLRGNSDPAIQHIPIILGGNQLNQQVCDYVGANAWVTDAMSGVRLCQKLTEED